MYVPVLLAANEDRRTPYAKAHDAILAATAKFNDALAEARKHAEVDIEVRTLPNHSYVRIKRLRAKD